MWVPGPYLPVHKFSTIVDAYSTRVTSQSELLEEVFGWENVKVFPQRDGGQN